VTEKHVHVAANWLTENEIQPILVKSEQTSFNSCNPTSPCQSSATFFHQARIMQCQLPPLGFQMIPIIPSPCRCYMVCLLWTKQIYLECPKTVTYYKYKKICRHVTSVKNRIPTLLLTKKSSFPGLSKNILQDFAVAQQHCHRQTVVTYSVYTQWTIKNVTLYFWL